MKIYVVFTDENISDFLRTVSKNDVVISKVKPEIPCIFIDVMNLSIPHNLIGSEFTSMINGFRSDLRSRLLPYANNLYQCSVEPVFRYFYALKKAISLGNKENQFVILQEAQTVIRTSTYYMAEHETQGYRWYQRGAVLGFYLYHFCKSSGIEVEIFKETSKKKLLLHNSLRIYAVIAVKFFKSLVELLKYKVNQGEIAESKCKKDSIVCVTRSKSQSKFLFPYLNRTNLDVDLIYGESTIDFGMNQKWLFGNNNPLKFAMHSLYGKANALSLLSLYFTLFRLLYDVGKQSTYLEIDGFKFDLRGAYREALILSVDLMLYQQCLEKSVSSLKVNTIAMITTEQKSPHAFIDAKVAKQFGLPCLQIMSCDQEYCYIPLPVAGDFLIVDTPYSKKKFKAVFPEQAIEYIGSLKGITETATCEFRNSLCFFTNPKRIDENKGIIRLLLDIEAENCLELTVKLHPRDNIENYKAFFNQIKIIKHSDPESEVLLQKVKLAITYNSGIVLDLLYANVPYLLCRTAPEDQLDLPYLDNEFKNVCRDTSHLRDMVINLDRSLLEFNSFRERFFSKNNIIIECDKIDDALIELASRVSVND